MLSAVVQLEQGVGRGTSQALYFVDNVAASQACAIGKTASSNLQNWGLQVSSPRAHTFEMTPCGNTANPQGVAKSPRDIRTVTIS